MKYCLEVGQINNKDTIITKTIWFICLYLHNPGFPMFCRGKTKNISLKWVNHLASAFLN